MLLSITIITFRAKIFFELRYTLFVNIIIINLNKAFFIINKNKKDISVVFKINNNNFYFLKYII